MKKIFLLIAVLTLSLTSCSDYLADNDNVNSPLADAIPPRLILPGAQTQAFRTQAINMNQLGSIMTNAWGGNIYQFTNPLQVEYSYNFSNGTYAAVWDGLYRSINNFQKIIETPLADQQNYIAISKIMKAHYMQYIVDLYGDCPYFDAFKGQNNLTPIYSDDALIYKDLIRELEEARTLIQNASPTAIGATTDVVFAGDMSKWLKLANTIELRILLRQSKLTDATTLAYLNTKYADLKTLNNFVNADVLINPGYSAANDAKQNPFYGNFGRDAAGSTTNTTNTLFTSSKFFADVLNGEAGGPTAGVIDPRRARIWTQVGGKVVGTDQGQKPVPGQNNSTNPTSRFGAGLTGYAGANAAAANVAASSKAGVLMLLSESKFLQAEAVQRGYLIGTAQTLFNEGVQASFTYLGATIGTYLTDIDSKANFGWSASTDKVQVILTQKWIALSGIHGVENYINYTRTGYPVIPGSINGFNLQPTRPKRLIYPLSEYNANSANVPILTSAQITTQGPFWYVP
ncbi:SusD/RagB family nutrient-binding outer membrane lipoprotein [Flavobacterium sp. I-SCBP12n]|uniref:SusD/RagB family nutrient-binding outer membrane lipoprotein n=1 Tax=Flavobacterium pygoscelis TaxID=2893176 RepID=A0A9X1XQK9_9FLAO|nr:MULTISPECIES: SusD/RagB family nutrient-binding outer membrane lipoprotein [Flavobacterium]MCK8141527.1 SusD/RagB family nutrient-binding outer membrane lipoprotein [Flavobacterium pygoscelis]